MALSRSFLKGMGITDEQISAIIEAHTETTEALKEQRDQFKADAEKLAEVQKELETLKGSGNDWQSKYEAEHKSFEAYKADQEEKATAQAKVSAYTKLLTDLGINEKRVNSILKVTDLKAIEMVDGAIKDADKVTEGIKTEWADFIPASKQGGAQTPTPPGNNNNNGGVDLGTLSMEDYIKARNQ